MTRRWGIVGAAALGVMVSFSSVFIYTFGVFLKPLATEFGWARGQISAGFAIVALTIAVASPFIGRLADRIGVRPVIAVASAIFGLTFLSLSALSSHLWHLYGVLFLMGIVANGSTQLTWARAIAARFDRHRGVALSLTMAGGGLGSMLMPWLASGMIERWGWRSAYLVFGLLVLAIGPALPLIAIRGNFKASKLPSVDLDLPAVNPNVRAFGILLVSFFLVSFGANACIAHLVPLLTDRGYAPGAAAAVASVLGLSSFVGRLIAGPLIDRFFATRVGVLFILGSAAGICLLALRTPVNPYIAAALVGIAVGAEADVYPYLISRYVGVARFGEFYGYAFSAYAVAGASGPLLMGLTFDQTRSYNAALAVVTLTTVLAAVMLLFLPRYRNYHATAS